MNSTDSSDTQIEDSPYNYTPTRWVCVLFVALFAINAAIHLFQSIRSRMWWLIPTLFTCAVGETIGWSGRLWSSWDPIADDPFMMQIVCTIIAPSFMTAAFFIILGRIIGIVGQEFSPLPARRYSLIFVTMDVIALIIQSVGGAWASSADDHDGSLLGSRIMLGGIIFQMVAVTLYVITAIDFLVRVWRQKPYRRGVRSLSDTTLTLGHNTSYKMDTFIERLQGKNIALLLAGLAISTVFLYIRSIYRTIELSEGWDGPIISNETYFNVFDGIPIAIAMYTMNYFHPSYYLPSGEQLPKSGSAYELARGSQQGSGAQSPDAV